MDARASLALLRALDTSLERRLLSDASVDAMTCVVNDALDSTSPVRVQPHLIRRMVQDLVANPRERLANLSEAAESNAVLNAVEAGDLSRSGASEALDAVYQRRLQRVRGVVARSTARAMTLRVQHTLASAAAAAAAAAAVRDSQPADATGNPLVHANSTKRAPTVPNCCPADSASIQAVSSDEIRF